MNGANILYKGHINIFLPPIQPLVRRKIHLRVGPEGVIHQDIDDDLVLPKSHVEELGVLQRYPEIVSCVCRVVAPLAEEEVKGRKGRRRKREKNRGRHDPASSSHYETLFYMFGGDEEAEEVVDRYGDGDLITEIRPRAASPQRSSSLQRRRQRIWEEQRERQLREREKRMHRWRDGKEYSLQQHQRQQPYSRSAWEVLTTAASKAEYTPRPAVYAPKTVEEVVTRITDATPAGVVDERLGDAVFDYVRIGDRASSTSPILTRRRVHSSER